MDNDKVKGIFWKSYNWFWNKWKDEILPRESDKWDVVVKDAKEVMCEHDCRMCRKIVLALLTELEERSWGNGEDNVRACNVSKESELTKEEKIEAVKGYGIADLLYVIREFEENPGKYEPEVIKQIGLQLMDKGIVLMY
ncbi:MAG: hypothetical protein LIP16_10180 [Clostridium sp.]|nr:hypothetical protein [Clostridium sp.]